MTILMAAVLERLPGIVEFLRDIDDTARAQLAQNYFEADPNEMELLREIYGLIIKMFFQQKEHNPPHFHAVYGEYVGAIDIRTLDMLEGDLPPKALALVREWAAQHQTELLKIWETQEFVQFPPLE